MQKVPKHYHKGPSIKYVRKIFRKSDISNPLIYTRMCLYQGVRNVSFSENFAHLKALSHRLQLKIFLHVELHRFITSRKKHEKLQMLSLSTFVIHFYFSEIFPDFSRGLNSMNGRYFIWIKFCNCKILRYFAKNVKIHEICEI